MKTRRKKPSARTSAPRKAAAPRKRSTRTVATLGTDCTIEQAPALHRQLVKMLIDRACVTLDVGTVKRCDTAGLQLLAAFIRERRAAGRPVEIAGASEHFLATAGILGLEALFGPAADGAPSPQGASA